MPTEWRQKLLSAAVRCDNNVTKRLLKQISPQEADLAEALDNLLRSFRFDQIVHVLESDEPPSAILG